MRAEGCGRREEEEGGGEGGREREEAGRKGVAGPKQKNLKYKK